MHKQGVHRTELIRDVHHNKSWHSLYKAAARIGFIGLLLFWPSLLSRWHWRKPMDMEMEVKTQVYQMSTSNITHLFDGKTYKLMGKAELGPVFFVICYARNTWAATGCGYIASLVTAVGWITYIGRDEAGLGTGRRNNSSLTQSSLNW